MNGKKITRRKFAGIGIGALAVGKIFGAVALTIFCQIIQAQPQSPAVSRSAESERIARLSDLAKVWGAVKFFHPFPAYREIDWDKALIETIPKVNVAKSGEEYAAAINSMFDALGDKRTRAEARRNASKTENKLSERTPKEPIQLADGVLTINLYAVAQKAAKSENQVFEQMTAKVPESVPQAKAIILDMRFPAEANEGISFDDEAVLFYADYFLRGALPFTLDKPVALSQTRYRIHNGLEAYSGGYSGYGSAMTMSDAKTLAAGNKAKTPPFVILINENSPSPEITGGLQSAGIAFVIQDAANAQAAAPTTTLKLTDNVQVKMRTGDLINADGSLGLTPDKTVPKGEAEAEARKIIAENNFASTRQKTPAPFTPSVNRKENAYAEMEYPAKEYRLLALFRYWNAINYFFPYKDLIGADWNEILPKYIPQMEAAQDANEYRLTVGKMVAEIHDSHGALRMPPLKNQPDFHYPPFGEAFAENQTFVAAVFDESSGFRVGDVILEADGEPIEKAREKFAVRVSSSTPQALMRNVHWMGIFRGEKDSKAIFKVRGLDGKERTIETVRTISGRDPRYQKFFQRGRQTPVETPVVSILPSGFAYVDLTRLTVAETDKMFETIKSAPAVIFDMRGYPNGTGFVIAPRLTTKKSVVGARFSRPQPSAEDFNAENLSPTYSFVQTLPPGNGSVYSGKKVVMLIDEWAQSQSEHTALFFEAARPDIKFIGTPTAGANGDVTNLVLPGGLVAWFSGHSIRHADGRQLQRLGIQPDIKVAPTIRGLVSGKDEILEAAIKYLQTNEK